MDTLTGWLVVWLVAVSWLFGCHCFGWLVGWLVDWLVDSPTAEDEVTVVSTLQMTPASSLCRQSPTPHPAWEQSAISLSVLLQRTSSNQILLDPIPKVAQHAAYTASL